MEIPRPKIVSLPDALTLTYSLDKSCIGRSAEFKITWEENNPNSIAKETGDPILSQLLIIHHPEVSFNVSRHSLPNDGYGFFDFEFTANFTVWSDTGFSETHKEDITHLAKKTTPSAENFLASIPRPSNPQTTAVNVAADKSRVPASLITDAELVEPPQDFAVGSVFSSMSLQHRLLAVGCWLGIGAVCAGTVILMDIMDDLESASTFAMFIAPVSIYFFYNKYQKLIRSPIRGLFRKDFRPNPTTPVALSEFFEFYTTPSLSRAEVRVVSYLIRSRLSHENGWISEKLKPKLLFSKVLIPVEARTMVSLEDKVDFAPMFEGPSAFHFQRYRIDPGWEVQLICSQQMNQIFEVKPLALSKDFSGY